MTKQQETNMQAIGGAWRFDDKDNLILYLSSLNNSSYLLMNEDGEVFRIKWGLPINDPSRKLISIKEAKRIINLNHGEEISLIKRIDE